MITLKKAGKDAKKNPFEGRKLEPFEGYLNKTTLYIKGNAYDTNLFAFYPQQDDQSYSVIQFDFEDTPEDRFWFTDATPIRITNITIEYEEID